MVLLGAGSEELRVVLLHEAGRHFLSTTILGFVSKYMVIPWLRHYGLLTTCRELLSNKLIIVMCLLSGSKIGNKNRKSL